MIESIDTSLIDWSRAQFAMTAMYVWDKVVPKAAPEGPKCMAPIKI